MCYGGLHSQHRTHCEDCGNFSCYPPALDRFRPGSVHTPVPGSNNDCQWKGIPVMCGPRGLKGTRSELFHNNGDGTFTDVTAKSGVAKTPAYYCFTALTGDFDNDGWPDIYVSCDSTPSMLFHNNHDGTFTETAVAAGVA